MKASIGFKFRQCCALLATALIGLSNGSPQLLADEALVTAEKTAALQDASAEPRESIAKFNSAAADRAAEVDRLLAAMTLDEKIGQMCQVWPEQGELTPALVESLRQGEVGSLINCPDSKFIVEVQRIAQTESRLGIPLLIGRDVVHGYRTIFPIPLGQAASWNPELVEQAARIAANEASSEGINWTFAPMVDVGRDPRWGRIAETFGEDPRLSAALSSAVVHGFQQEDDEGLHGLVACAKHFAAYGLSEGGRDYNRASLSIADLHNIHLPAFKSSLDVGCRTFMTTFSEVNGIPGTAHAYLLQDVLCDSWKFSGVVVSDWNSVIEMVAHGFSADEAEAAQQAVNAGVHMEMVSPTFHDNLSRLVEQGRVDEAALDNAVRRVLRLKLELARNDSANQSAEKSVATGATAPRPGAKLLHPRSLELARRAARESIVLLKNAEQTLPLHREELRRVAVIGPLADAPLSQLGCWSVDGSPADAITPLAAIRNAVGDTVEIAYVAGMTSSYANRLTELAKAQKAAEQADVVLLFVGEDAVLSGEARSRMTLDLPGAQAKLVEAVAASGTPVAMVVLAGRPLAIGAEIDAAAAVLYAWHPGTMGGPAIVDLLLGDAAPTGRLPVTMPKHVGQVPLYYSHSNTGRPSPADFRPLSQSQGKDLPAEFQYRSHYVDGDPFPLFPFGYGLTYTTFCYDGFELGAAAIGPQQTLAVRARITNTGTRSGVETAQLYVRDLAASIVRPVRELKAFRRVHLRPGESQAVEFALTADDLRYFDNQGKSVLEPGKFAVWVGGDSTAALGGEFELTTASDPSSQSAPAVARAPKVETTKQPVRADSGT
ncbi:beta-glucosidase BglX [Lacipirellula parvula]|uniref:beta-glucosidase n=1 Tax=Lacipirellula parvula TaxID=2650471 RepID=A0A5K7XJN4_9BACT|nr:beta-glucosidase BglX [Lacipirellula parvula]BBO33089.1 beta-glucosidase [Lacipirellula parvula]